MIIDVSKNTFEAWRRGEKRIRGFDYNSSDVTYLENDFVTNEEMCGDVVKAPKSPEYPNSEHVRKLLDAVNCPDIRKDLLYVIDKYKLAGNRRRDMCTWNQDGSYVFFLRCYMQQRDFGIPRKFVREEYVDPEEWEFVKEADEYAIVRQNPYMRVEDSGENIKITMWGD
ncbi:MAG: hypothetical protein FWH47_00395 [Methanomassiliicoccaceae archaeon]|nr:hypothetical protein [Methanomassiliicoccaceae archaeon]